jgi:hypothetical protein
LFHNHLIMKERQHTAQWGFLARGTGPPGQGYFREFAQTDAIAKRFRGPAGAMSWRFLPEARSTQTATAGLLRGARWLPPRDQLDVLLSSNQQNRALVKKSKSRCRHAAPRVSGQRRA